MEGETKIKDEPPDLDPDLDPDPDPDPSFFGYNWEERSQMIKTEFPVDLPFDVFQRYPWLQNSETDTLFCGPCSQHFDRVAEFTLNGTLEELAAHEQDPSHREAVMLMSAEPDPQTGKTSATRLSYELHKRKRKFCSHWLFQFPWLHYDEEGNRMFCKLCQQHRSSSSSFFVKGGNSSFRLTTIQSHLHCRDHQRAVQAEKYSRAAETTTKKQWPTSDPAAANLLLNKFLGYFSWLSYKEELNMWGCKVCEKHCGNTMFLQLVEGDVFLNYELIKSHSASTDHADAERKEVESWTDLAGIASDYDTCAASCFEAVEGERAFLAEGRNESNTVSREGLDESQMDLEGPQKVGTYQRDWMITFPWLEYSDSVDVMRCTLCAKHGEKNMLAGGTRTFRKSVLVTHSCSVKHSAAVAAELAQKQSPVMAAAPNLTTLQKCDSIESGSSSDDSGFGVLDAENIETPEPTAKLGHFSFQPSKVETNETLSNEKCETDTNGRKRVRRFLPSWKEQFEWLEFDSVANLMFCAWCRHVGFKNSYTQGTSSFRLNGLQAHNVSENHLRAKKLQMSNFSNGT